ncbi:helix-turn-helix transcriptional regulator [Kocuria marina]|uniref:helix-turn-helix transcriptional regulator n=1 Tax=Kocuria marina TaxID=223184 RepID=UPI003B3B6E2B
MNDHDLNEKIAEEVRAWMARRRRSQSDLARHLGVARSAISVRMNGARDFSLAELVEIASWLEITLADLIGPEILNARGGRSRDLVGAGTQRKARPVKSDQSGLRGCAPRDLNPEPID